MSSPKRVKRVALIPARGGSKGLPRKNLAPLAGRPLIVHTIAAALDSGAFARVVVSSEDPEILAVAAEHGAEALERPAELASDEASSLDVVAHALCALASAGAATAGFALLQPTSPLRTRAHIRAAVRLFDSSGARSLVSVTECEHAPHKSLVVGEDGRAAPLFDWASLTAPRQALPRTFRPNGALYLGECEGFLATRDLFAAPLVLFEMPAEASIDIDSALDLRWAELLLAGDG